MPIEDGDVVCERIPDHDEVTLGERTTNGRYDNDGAGEEYGYQATCLVCGYEWWIRDPDQEADPAPLDKLIVPCRLDNGHGGANITVSRDEASGRYGYWADCPECTEAWWHSEP